MSPLRYRYVYGKYCEQSKGESKPHPLSVDSNVLPGLLVPSSESRQSNLNFADMERNIHIQSVLDWIND